MAVKKVLVNLDFNGNQIINVRAEVAASAPATGTPGRFYFNTTQQKLYVYTTSGWKVVGQDVPANLVTADNDLTANMVLVGDGSKKAKASSFTIGKSVPSDAAFSDEKVRQEPQPSSTNAELPLIFSQSVWGTGASRTGYTYISNYMTYNPSTHVLTLQDVHVHSLTIDGNEAATKAYVDTQDQKINDRISNISGFGRYLSGWDMATGKPASVPTTSEYVLRSGDYFVINNVPSLGTKYKPNQTGTWNTSQQFARTATNETCVVGGYWKYDGSTWSYFAPESAVSLPAFTNNTLGGIKGHEVNGYVYHVTNDTEGYGMVYGWATKADNNNSHTITLQGDVTTVSGSHTNANGSNVTISVTIADGAVTTVKINDGAVTGAKIATDAVDHTKIKAKWVGEYIAASQTDVGPYWQATGNANEYKAVISGVTRNGSVRLCESNGGSFNGAKEVECVIEYGEDETGIFSATAYINSATAPTAGQYYFHCRKEFD